MRVLVRDAQVMLGSRGRALLELQSRELEMALRDGELSRRAAHRAAPIRVKQREPNALEILVESRARAGEPQTDDEGRQLLRHELSEGAANVIQARPRVA